LNSGDYYYARNLHTDVSLLEKDLNGGEVTASYVYKPYGAQDSLSSGDPEGPEPLNSFRFNDKRLDSGSATLDMGARRYRVDLGRFMQRDSYPVAVEDRELALDLDLQNLYSFPGANPINLVELDGHRPECTAVPDQIKLRIRGFGVTPSFGNFKNACGIHDECYGYWKSWRKICDDAFLRNMNRDCDEQFPSSWKRPWQYGTNSPRKKVCRRVAHLYHWGVWQFGDFKSWKVKAKRPDPRGETGCPWWNRRFRLSPSCLRWVHKHSYPPYDKDPGTWKSRAEIAVKLVQELRGLIPLL